MTECAPDDIEAVAALCATQVKLGPQAGNLWEVGFFELSDEVIGSHGVSGFKRGCLLGLFEVLFPPVGEAVGKRLDADIVEFRESLSEYFGEDFTFLYQIV